jgi:hypothetical protein
LLSQVWIAKGGTEKIFEPEGMAFANVARIQRFVDAKTAKDGQERKDPFDGNPRVCTANR